MEGCFKTPEAKEAVARIYHQSHGRPAARESQEPRVLHVPALAVRVDGQLELFEETHFLNFPWKLAEQDAALSEQEFPSRYVAGETGEVDVSERGKVEIHFIQQAQRQLRLMGFESGWDLAGLTNWLDRQIPHPDLTRTEATLFIHRVLTELLESRELTIDHLAQQKYRLRQAVADKIDQHRKTQRAGSYNRMLFSQEAAEVEVGPEVCFELTEEKYAPNSYYEGSYRWRRALFKPVGELNGEEFQCATYIDQLDGVRHWVRNLERRPDASFWLQTSTDKFYPDFVAQLNDERFLVVEYKGHDRYTMDDSKEKRALGKLWEARSGGRCLFVMPDGPDLQAIVSKIG